MVEAFTLARLVLTTRSMVPRPLVNASYAHLVITAWAAGSSPTLIPSALQATIAHRVRNSTPSTLVHLAPTLRRPTKLRSKLVSRVQRRSTVQQALQSDNFVLRAITVLKPPVTQCNTLALLGRLAQTSASKMVPSAQTAQLATIVPMVLKINRQ